MMRGIKHHLILYKTAYKALFGPGFKSRHLHTSLFFEKSFAWQATNFEEPSALAMGRSVWRVVLTKCHFCYNICVYYVYILKLENHSFYIGYTADLRKRIALHKRGMVKSTRKFKSISLAYYSAFVARKKAIDFEKYLKSSSGFAFRNKHLVEPICTQTLPSLHHLKS